MGNVTLHFKAQIGSRECAVCGARLDRTDRDHWWLRNTWTASVSDYQEGGGTWPTDWFLPCGRLPDESKTPNGRAEAPDMAPRKEAK